jgi:hypothetical protein
MAQANNLGSPRGSARILFTLLVLGFLVFLFKAPEQAALAVSRVAGALGAGADALATFVQFLN